MARHLTEDDAKVSLNAHVAEKGAALREKYGPAIGWPELQAILRDRNFVRYPCEIVFDRAPLQAGEFAYPAPKGSVPDEGFTLYVHPFFMTQLDRVPWLVLYQLVLVNYGPFASAADAEAFGAYGLGLAVEDYYQGLCEMAGQLADATVTETPV
jgi:hypothetical protein